MLKEGGSTGSCGNMMAITAHEMAAKEVCSI
jgi:hypothetical protein